MSLDYHDEAYAGLKRQVDKLIASAAAAAEYEAQKGGVLAECDPYLAFLSGVSRRSRDDVQNAIREISGDTEFFALMGSGLQDLAGYAKSGVPTGEIRIHAHTLYVLTRLLAPAVMVETGVANGKSSAFILRAMERSGRGKLWSIDLPTYQEKISGTLEGYDALVPKGLQPGWLIPQTLRSRWELRLGSATELLPALKEELPELDVFFHDSLHTYEHMHFELALATGWVRPGGVVLCDDIQDNKAFEEISAPYEHYAFGTLGAFRIPGTRS